MKKITKHVMIPLKVTVIFFTIGWLPVELLVYRNRGLIAALVAVSAGTIGIVGAVKTLIGRFRGDANSSL